MTESDRLGERGEKVNCDLHRWKDTCSVMVFSDAASLTFMPPCERHKHTHADRRFREANLGTT